MKRFIIPAIAPLSVSLFAVMGCNADKNKNAQQKPLSGAQLYSENCIICHGADGQAGLAGASDLSQSTLQRDQVVEVVTKGRNGMRSFQNEMSKDEIHSVVEYIETLRK